MWQYFHQNGQLKDIGYYADDKKTGEWKYYYNSGTLESVGNYTNGQKSGTWKYYHKDGKLARTEEGSYERRNDDPLIAGVDSQVQISQVEPSSKVFVQGVDYNRSAMRLNRKKEFTDKEEVITSRNDFAEKDGYVQTYSVEGDPDLANQLKAKEEALANEEAFADYLKKELEDRLAKVKKLEAIITMNNEAANKVAALKENAIKEVATKEEALKEAAKKEADLIAVALKEAELKEAAMAESAMKGSCFKRSC